MPKGLNRRQFLKAVGVGAVGATAASAAPNATATAHAAPTGKQADESKFTVCDMCFNRCGAVAHVRDGKVVKLDPNPNFTKSRGMLCARGVAGVSQLYDPDRLKTPLLRVGKRGENKWKPISWEEALNLTAEKFLDIAKRHTRCGVVFSSGADMQTTFMRRFAQSFGSFSFTTQESLCLLSMHRGYLDTFGEIPTADVLHCKYIFMPGSNRIESLVTPDSMDLVVALKNGAKFTVVDPRYTKSAAMATDWLQIRPGTDLALALALIHVIVTEKLYDEAWVNEFTFGLDKLVEHVAARTPEWAAAETGIPAQTIVRVAREMAAAAPAALVYPGRRTSDYVDSTQIRRGWAILNGLLGNFDKQGGLMANPTFALKSIPLEAPWYDDTPPERLDEPRIPLPFKAEASFVPLRESVLEGKPHQAKGWFIYKTNPMQTAPCRSQTIAMMEQMEFVVTVDILMTDTALMSDLVLPAPTYLERTDPCQALSGGPAGPCVVWRDPVVPPLYDTRPLFDIVKGLAQRMNLGQHFDFTVEEFREVQISGLGEKAKQDILERGVFVPEGQKLYGLYDGKKLKTSSKKVDLWSGMYQKKQLPPLPDYRPHPLPDKDALRLVLGRNACITQTSSQNNALLHEFVPTNTLDIHPETAARLGIKNGEKVLVQGPVESQTLNARYTTGMEANTVYMHSGFGSLSPGLSLVYKNGASIVALMSDSFDEISGNAVHQQSFVRVTPADSSKSSGVKS